MLRIESAQLRPKKGKVDENLARVRDWIRGVSGDVDLIVFPECAFQCLALDVGRLGCRSLVPPQRVGRGGVCSVQPPQLRRDRGKRHPVLR
jgi:hypothetical protein